MDRRLHDDRLDGRAQRRHRRPWASLPDGAYVVLADGRPARIAPDHAVPWTPAGAAEPVDRPGRGDATVLTPAATVEVLAAGYCADRPV
jgi:hypothetical protein